MRTLISAFHPPQSGSLRNESMYTGSRSSFNNYTHWRLLSLSANNGFRPATSSSADHAANLPALNTTGYITLRGRSRPLLATTYLLASLSGQGRKESEVVSATSAIQCRFSENLKVGALLGLATWKEGFSSIINWCPERKEFIHTTCKDLAISDASRPKSEEAVELFRRVNLPRRRSTRATCFSWACSGSKSVKSSQAR